MTNMSLDLYIGLLELYSTKLIKYKNILSELFIAVNKYHKHYEEVREKYKLKEKLGFNFFTLISKNYHYENYHSDILKVIFTGDLNKDIIINKDYFRQFLVLIGLKDWDKEDFVTNITCTREEKRIDILIKIGKKAIIIENKINGAVDQPNQLARYLEALEKEKFEVIKIVYLTLTGEKTIDFSTYSDEYKNYIPRIKSKLVHLAAVDETDKNIFIRFLKKCIKITKKNQNGKAENKEFEVFLKHYRNLIMHLGGEIMMRNFQKELVETIYSKKENIEALDDFKDLLTNEALMKELRSECILAAIKKNIPEYIDHSYGCTIYKKWNNDFAIVCYIYEYISYGFITLEDMIKFSTNKRRELKNILNSDCFNEFSNEEAQEEDQDPEWIFRNFDKDDINHFTIEETADKIIEILRLLEEECKHLLKDKNAV